MFGELVIMYLFLGGCGAGMLLVSSLWSFVFHGCMSRTRRESDAFKAFRNRCFVVGTVVAAVGAACLLADLGKPERFILLFFRPNQTYLTFGTFVLTLLVGLGLFLSVANCLYVPWVKGKPERFILLFFRPNQTYLTFGTFVLTLLVGLGLFLSVANCLYVPWVKARLKAVAEVACSISAVAVMAYTGLFLQGLKAVAFWDTWLIPALFVLSAISMGISACLIAGSLIRDSWLMGRYVLLSHKAHLVVVVAEAVALVTFLVIAATGRGAAPESLTLMLSDPLVWWFGLGVVLCGLVVPCVGSASALVRRGSSTFPLADVLCLFGGFALRLCIVSAGLH